MPCEHCAEIKTDTINQEACGANDFDPNTWKNCKLNCDCHDLCNQEGIAKHEEYYQDPDEGPYEE